MLSIPLDMSSPLPLYRQIYQYVKGEIADGALAYPCRLPSTRGLSAHLGVSRNTVDMAYQQLLAEGYVTSEPKRGYFVSRVDPLLPISKGAPSLAPAREKESEHCDFDFSPFLIDLSHFPYHTWRQIAKSCLGDDGRLLLPGDHQGDLPLREALASYLRASRGVTCSPEQIVIGAGADYLLQLLTLILGTDDAVAMENPAYPQAYRIFKSMGKPVRPIPLDFGGLDVRSLSKADIQAVYVTPSHQYPLGIVMPIQRRGELLEWAYSKEGRYIIEDDHDSEFRYRGKPIPSLQGIDSKERVIYVGTFSKAISPSIRVGYMVLPGALLQTYRERLSFCSCTVPRLEQAILTEFLSKGYFERHLNRMRKTYRGRHDALLAALRDVANAKAPRMEILGENAGIHLVIRPRLGMTEEEFLARAKERGVKAYGLSGHFISPPADPEPGFLLGYASLSEEEIREGIRRLFL